jgi:hypothetical protein
MKLGRYFGLNNNVEGLPGAAGRARWVTRVLAEADSSKQQPISLTSPYMVGLRRSVKELKRNGGMGNR